MRSDAPAGCDDAGKIQRVGGADGDQILDRGCATNRAHQADGFSECELLARDACDKASAANLATRFQAMIDTQQLAPRQHQAFAFEQAFEDDAIALEQYVSDGFLGSARIPGFGEAAPGTCGQDVRAPGQY